MLLVPALFCVVHLTAGWLVLLNSFRNANKKIRALKHISLQVRSGVSTFPFLIKNLQKGKLT